MKYSTEEIQDFTEKVRSFASSAVSENRYAHSVRTAEMAKRLCALYELDENLGYFSGIAHDICKKMDDKKLFALVKKDNKPVSELERDKPGLLHGRAAAVLLEEKFDFHDERILEAVAVHTFGMKGMNDYSKVLFIADKIEPGREHITKEYLDASLALPLNRLLEKVLHENLSFLEKNGKKVAPESRELYDWVRTI